MKRSSLIYGFNPYALRSAGRNDPLVAVSLQELARIGIPARKAPRVMQELQLYVYLLPTRACAGAKRCSSWRATLRRSCGRRADRGKNRAPGGNIPVLFYCPGGCGVL